MLLECTYLYNEELFRDCRKKIVKKYLDDDDYKFFLNDMSRYYKTLLTDFHYKIHENDKKWGVRSTKLKFSRKLIYLSILLTIQSTVSLEFDKKIEKILDLLDEEPLRRVYNIVQSKAPEELKIFISSYNYFLSKIGKEEVRNKLDKLTREDREKDETYKEIREQAKQFKSASFCFLKKLYDEEGFELLIL